MYGEEVETLVVDEDEQSFEVPIIKPVRDIKFEVGHGKTIFMDMLVEQTHCILTFYQNSEKHMRYTDNRVGEQERRISIKAVPM
ncbi:110 kDa U5 small nuclear ribonucleoprotein component CLO [Tanacetum coccineum]